MSILRRSTNALHRLTRRRAMIGVASSLIAPGVTWAQSERPLRLVVHTSTGTATDAAFRAIQPALMRVLGGPVVVENVPGAGGMIAWQTVARSAADGHTLAATSNNLVIQPHLMSTPQVDVIAQLAPIAIIGSTPVMTVVNPKKMSARNAREFIAELKARGGELNFGSAGAGSSLHLATEILLDEVGAKVRHVPYRSGGQLVTDLLGGQIDFATISLSVALPHVESGALRAIGVCTPQRVPLASAVPTFVEQGVNFTFDIWLGVVGPKGMPPDVVRKLNSAFATALSDTAVKDTLAKQGNVIQALSPEESQKVISQDFTRYGAIVKKLGLQSQS